MNKNFTLETRYSTFKKYQENYESDLKAYLQRYEENTELDFLQIDLFSHKEFLKYLLTKDRETNELDEGVFNQQKINSQKRIIAFIENKIDVENKKTRPLLNSSLQWHGTQTQFVELSKSLMLNGNITGPGNQEDNIKQLANLLNFELNNTYKLLNDIKTTRNNGSETLFLDKLKKSLFDYITQEKKK